MVVRDPLVPLFREGRVGRVFLRYGVTAQRDGKKNSELSPLVAVLPRVPPERPFAVVAHRGRGARVPRLARPRRHARRHAAREGRGLRRLSPGGRGRGVRGSPARRGRRRDDVRGRRGRARTFTTSTRCAPRRSRNCLSSSVPRPTRSTCPRGTCFRRRRRRASSSFSRREAPASCGTRASRATSPSYRVYRREKDGWKRIAEGLRDPAFFDARAGRKRPDPAHDTA